MSTEYAQPKRGMAVFDVLAWAVVIVGVLNVIVGIVLLFDDSLFGLNIVGAIAVTALFWAGISLATVIAVYIAPRAE